MFFCSKGTRFRIYLRASEYVYAFENHIHVLVSVFLMAAYCCTSLPVGELLQFGTLKGVGIAVTEDIEGAVVDYLFAGKVIGLEVIEVGFGFLFVLRNDG